MRTLGHLDKYRSRQTEIRIYGVEGDEYNGMFMIPGPVKGVELGVICARGEGWEHVSVSLKKRTPRWEEMAYIKRLFFKDDENVMQLHVAVTSHINIHQHCLHLWRPMDVEIPLPPKEFV